jgi:hypothetical protein
MLDEMNAQREPRSYSERELTLQAISITSKRARAVQRRLTSLRSPTDDTGPPGPTDDDGDPPAPADYDLQLDEQADDEPDEELDDEEALPNPMITDGLLRHYLEQAAIHQGDGNRGWRGLVMRGLSPRGWRHQAAFNSMIVHALHQLDHRSQLQQETLAELEGETAAIRRALNDLESRFFQPS